MYFCNMNTEIDAIRQYLEARKAVRNATNPKAFLRLGKLYAQGIGTKENHVLSNYFYEKALAMGCKEAESLIDHEYDTGQRSIVRDIVTAMENIEAVAPYKIERLKSRLEKERPLKKNDIRRISAIYRTFGITYLFSIRIIIRSKAMTIC